MNVMRVVSELAQVSIKTLFAFSGDQTTLACIFHFVLGCSIWMILCGLGLVLRFGDSKPARICHPNSELNL